MPRRMADAILAIALLVVAAPLWADTNAQEVEEDNSIESTLVTPHKDWGAGYAGGRIRALFFIYTGPYDGTWEDTGTRVREVVELRQRFDIDGDAVLFCGKGDNWVFHGLKFGQDRAERLLQKPYDLYVIGAFAFERLPAKMQYEILKQVARGAGLLCCGYPAKDFMTEPRLISAVPAWLTAGVPALDGKPFGQYVSTYHLGKGRGVWLNWGAHGLTPAHPFTYRGLAEYDYWMLAVGRAALWAAGRDGPVAVASVLGAEAPTLQRGQTAAGEVAITIDRWHAVGTTVELELRRADDGLTLPLGKPKVALLDGEIARVPVTLPTLRAGDYHVDVVVRTARGVEAFGAGALTVTSDFGLEKVTTDRTFAEQGETTQGTVTVKGEVPPGASLRVDLRDSDGRILRREQLPLKPGQADYSFSYTPDRFATVLMRAQAVLSVGSDEVELKETQFTVPKRRQGQHNFVMWDAPRDVLGFYAIRKMQEAGQNTYLLGSFSKSEQPPALRACDASLVPYSTRILDPKDENGYMQPVCWNDEPAVTEHVQQIVDNQAALREQGVFVYSLGDEGVTLGCCVHPACLAVYRRYLAAQYGTIEALNASWGTEYKSFDEVDLLNHQDNMETAAAKASFPRWYDRQAFARYNLMQFSGRFVKAYRALDPLGLTGFEGTGGFGDDYDQITSINTFYGPYPSIGDDILRSVYPRDRVRSNWMGYSKTGDALSDAAWRMVMRGMDSIWYWMWSGIGNWRGYTRPTLDFWPIIDDLAGEMRPVRQGLGDLLIKSEPVHSGIAIFYSLPSALAHNLETGGQFTNAQMAHETWVRLTNDLGLDFRYLTSRMLTGGALDSGEFKVLLLPLTTALSPEEAAAIRRFAESGGTVVADVRPGVFDHHCKPVSPGLLDDLFGIQRTGRGNGVEAPLSIDLALEGNSLRADLGKVRVDLDVQAAQALLQAAAGEGQAPVLAMSPVGKGRAVLLNFQLPTADPREPRGDAARDVVRFLYGLAGVKGVLDSAAPDGGPLKSTETRVWRTGDGLVFGLWRQMENEWFSPKSGTLAGKAAPAKVTLRSPQHIYDLRAHKYLGRTADVETALRWGRASFFLAVPYAIGPLDVDLSSRQPKAGETVTVTLRLKVPAQAKETFAVHVEVLDPGGQELLWGRKVVLLKQGQGTVEIARAYNDTPGVWKVRATELFSNQTAEATWTVREEATR